MGRADIEKIRAASKSSTGPGWTTWYDQFAIKSVLKRVYKQVPGRSDEFDAVAAADNEALGITFDHKPVDSVDPIADLPAPVPAPVGSSQRLAAKIAQRAEQPETVVENENPEPVAIPNDPMDADTVAAELSGANEEALVVTPDGEIIPTLKRGSDLPKKKHAKSKQTDEEFKKALE